MSPAQAGLPAQRGRGSRVNRRGRGAAQSTPADQGEFFDIANVSNSDSDASPCHTPIAIASPPDSNDTIPAQMSNTLPEGSVALSATSTDPLLDTLKSSKDST